MFIIKNKTTGDIHGPYETKRHAYSARPAHNRDDWEPVSIGKRSIEEAMALGAAINSSKVSRA